jgi:hypothetical protein
MALFSTPGFSKYKVFILSFSYPQTIRQGVGEWSSTYEYLLAKANLPTLEVARQRLILKEVYNSVHRISPPMLWDLFSVKQTDYNLRSRKNLNVPHCRTTNFGKNSVTTYGSVLWNTLTNDVKDYEPNAFYKSVETWQVPGCKCNLCKNI